MIPDPDLHDPVDGPERPLWEPLPSESGRAFMAFAAYRDLGPLRTARRAAGQFYGAEGDPTEAQLKQFKRWSADHAWVDRADAWDLHLDEIARAEQVEEVKAMNRRHAVVAQNMQARVQETIRLMVEDPQAKLTPSEAARWFDVAVKVERLARGEPDSVVGRPVDEGDLEAKRARAHAVLDELAAARARRSG